MEILPSPSRRPYLDVALLFLIAMVLQVLLGFPLQLYSVLLGLAGTQLFCFLLPALVYVRLQRAPLLAALRLRPISPGMAGVCVLLALTGLGLNALIEQATRPLVEAVAGPELMRRIGEMMAHLAPTTWLGWLGAVVVFGGIAGICEELFFRGAIQGTLEGRHPRRAIIITALLFGLAHLNPCNFIGPVLFGLVFGFITWRCQSIVPAMIWHAVNNAVGMTVAFAQPGMQELPLSVQTALAFAFFPVFWLCLRLSPAAASTPSSPLSVAVSPHPSFRYRLPLAAAVGAVILLVGTFSSFGAVRLSGDFENGLRQNDVFLYRKNVFGLLDTSPGDVLLVYKEKEGLVLSRLEPRPDRALYVRNLACGRTETPRPIQRSDLRGKLLWRLGNVDPQKLLQAH